MNVRDAVVAAFPGPKDLALLVAAYVGRQRTEAEALNWFLDHNTPAYLWLPDGWVIEIHRVERLIFHDELGGSRFEVQNDVTLHDPTWTLYTKWTMAGSMLVPSARNKRRATWSSHSSTPFDLEDAYSTVMAATLECYGYTPPPKRAKT